ncbi:MAG: peptide ABC transporter substrate-binding protein [Rhizobiaceae bacterium MnEN-MB40S]|nr:MAG: peptide ABC transporter substrate-binding protein [Rhizobiaceae bacterium MnEN-MB40S]
MKRGLLFTLMVCLVFIAGAAQADEALKEPPILAPLVESGKLPPMKERLPKDPFVVDFAKESKTIGRYCCQLVTLLGSAKDIRMMTVYGYARLIGFGPDYKLRPDILESFESEEGRIFTLRIREGHKWSDGEPFTSEDFRYFWEDVANNGDLSGSGVPQVLLSNGKPPKFEVIDERTVRYTWEDPNPAFPLGLAGPSPEYIYMPSHYMKQFHTTYNDADTLAKMAEDGGYRNWAAMHTVKGRQYRTENPELPTLQPWRNTTDGPSKRYVFERNPYYHRVDPNGQQLPYIDEVIILTESVDIIPAKAGAGESDLQARYLHFDDYTFLKQGEETQDYNVLLWRNGVANQISLYPNLNVTDPEWNKLNQDVRFRRALSLGLNRDEINQQLFFGLAKAGGDTVLQESPLYKEEYASAWTNLDVEQANKLLDEIGLTERDSKGIRLLPNGKPMELIVESAGESTEETDALELVRYHWEQLGIKVFTRTLQRDIQRRRFLTGETIMTISKGLDIGLATPETNPEQLAPVSPSQPNWPKWGQYTETNGKAGEPVSLPAAERLLELYNSWRQSTSVDQQEAIWAEMLEIYSENVFSIGVARETIQPVVVDKKLQNVPADAIFAWSPTAFFGIFRPDTFWFEE